MLMIRYIFLLILFMATSVALADGPTAAADDEAAVKAMGGMSVLGNNEAPKSLVIVPWKSSELGDDMHMGSLLDERAKPVDKQVFARQLDYYEVRTGAPAYAKKQTDR